MSLNCDKSLEAIELVLPWPPSLNNYKRVGRIVTTKSGKLYQQRVNNNETKMYYYQVWMKVKPIFGLEGSPFYQDGKIKLGVTMALHPPHEKRYDIDNFCKVQFDALTNAKVWADDSQVCRLFIQKKAMKPEGEVSLSIYALE